MNTSSASANTTAETAYHSIAVKMTNAERARRDLSRLAANSCMTRYARAHAKRMAAANKIYHQDIRKVLYACNLKRVGENVAMGYQGDKVVPAWMRSTGHRRNILTSPYRRIALEAVKSSSGRWYVSQLFGTPA